MIEISFQATWVKSSFMRYLIDINTNSEMTKWMEALYEHFKKVRDTELISFCWNDSITHCLGCLYLDWRIV